MNLLTTPDLGHGLLELFNPAGLTTLPNGYSHVAVVRLRRVIHIAGQGGEDADGHLSPGFGEQVEQALDNLQIALRSAQASLADVARLRILVVDHDEDRLGIIARQVRRRWPNRAAPTCTLILCHGWRWTACCSRSRRRPTPPSAGSTPPAPPACGAFISWNGRQRLRAAERLRRVVEHRLAAGLLQPQRQQASSRSMLALTQSCPAAGAAAG
jgi:enamine deaminase RidA (YjgF/YER057c/UK114 family)